MQLFSKQSGLQLTYDNPKIFSVWDKKLLHTERCLLDWDWTEISCFQPEFEFVVPTTRIFLFSIFKTSTVVASGHFISGNYFFCFDDLVNTAKRNVYTAYRRFNVDKFFLRLMPFLFSNRFNCDSYDSTITCGLSCLELESGRPLSEPADWSVG